MTGINKRYTFSSTVGALAALSMVGCAGNGDFATQDFVGADLGPRTTDGTNDDDNLNNGNNTGENVATLRGFVKDPQGRALSNVRVYNYDGWETKTDDNGRFEVPDVEDGHEFHMTFEREGYAGNFNVFRAMAGGNNFFSHVMAPVDLETEFDSEDGIAFNIDGSHDFMIPGGIMQTLDGEAFDGNVHLQATVWDRKTPLDDGGEFLASPGNGRGIMADGTDQLLFTFGMFQLVMTSDEGTPLQPGPGFEMLVQVPPNANLQDGESVPFWDFDDTQNTWIEQDQGQINTLPNGEQNWEFQPIQGLPARKKTGWIIGNPDKPVLIWVSAQATGEVVDPQGNPKPNVPVRVIAADQTFMQATQTNAQGQWSVNVPPVVSNPFGPNGRPMFVEIDYEVAEKPSLWRDNPSAPPGPGGTMGLGTEVVGSMSCLAGTVVDSDGAPVEGITVLSIHGGNDLTDGSGEFCMNVPKWQPATAYAAPVNDSTLGFEPRKYRPVPNTEGSCAQSCPNRVTLRAYPNTVCAEGTITVDGFAADAVNVDVFDARFPGSPIYSTITNGGDYCAPVPADIEAVVRVGASDLVDANSCGQHPITAARDDYSQCDGGWCESLTNIDCGSN